MAMQLNLPEVVAEVSEVCDRYEKALIDNDVAALKSFFWRSEMAIRFGVTEELYGADEIDAFRDNRKVLYTDRTVLRHDVMTLSRSMAVATLQFSVLVRGKLRHGRQTQVWAKLDAIGWKVISAHVSHRVMPSNVQSPECEYVDAATKLLELPLDPGYRDAVAANVAAMAGIVQPLMSFELPPDIEPAATFEP